MLAASHADHRTFDGRTSGVDDSAGNEAFAHIAVLHDRVLDGNGAHDVRDQIDRIAEAEEQIPRHQRRGIGVTRRPQSDVETRRQRQAVQNLRLNAQGYPMQIFVVLAGRLLKTAAVRIQWIAMLLAIDDRIRRAGDVLEVVLEKRTKRKAFGDLVERRIRAQGQAEATARDAVGKLRDVARESRRVVGVVVDEVAGVIDVVADIHVKAHRHVAGNRLEVVAADGIQPKRRRIRRKRYTAYGRHQANAELASGGEAVRDRIGHLAT